MEEETQNLTPELDSVDFQNQDDNLSQESLKVESPVQSESSMASLATEPDSTDLPDGSLVPQSEDAAKSEQQECISCNHQELEKRLRELQHEIFKTLNQNLLLKKRFLLAKHVLKRDMGVEVGCVEELVKEREEEGWCGCKGVAEALRKKLSSLKTLVREKREESKVVRAVPFECPLPEDERIQGLLCMEREYMIQNVRREEQKWVEDRDRLARKLEFFVEKNKKLEEEASSIRSDLCMELEALEVVSVARFLEVQRKMEQSAEKKFKLQNTLLAAEASVRANEAEIQRLKEEIRRQEALLAESETALKAQMAGSEEDLGALVEEFRIERQATSRMFREGLEELLGTYGALLEGAESVEDVSARCAESVESVLTSDDAESQLVAEIRKRRSSGNGDAGAPKHVKFQCPVEQRELTLGSSTPKEHPQSEGSTKPVQVEEAKLESLDSLSTIEPVADKMEEPNLKSSATSGRQDEKEANLESSYCSMQETEKECRDAMKAVLRNTIGDFDGNELSTFSHQTSLIATDDASREDEEEVHLVRCLEEELLELSSTFARRKRALRKRHRHLQTLFGRLKSEASQLLELRGRLSKESAGVRLLANKLRRLAKEATPTDAREPRAEDAVEAFRFGDASEVEDSKALLHVLRTENASVKRLIRAVCRAVDEDVAKFLQLSAIKIFF